MFCSFNLGGGGRAGNGKASAKIINTDVPSVAKIGTKIINTDANTNTGATFRGRAENRKGRVIINTNANTNAGAIVTINSRAPEACFFQPLALV